jgi:hypothetical protein
MLMESLHEDKEAPPQPSTARQEIAHGDLIVLPYNPEKEGNTKDIDLFNFQGTRRSTRPAIPRAVARLPGHATGVSGCEGCVYCLR